LQQVLDSRRGVTMGSPKTPQKKNTFKVGEGSK
jgi:hypothetical protein